jgi:predicted amidohydrolase
MKICVAQTRPVRGDIQTNIRSHKRLIELAVSKGAEMIFFPELSLTGYEPRLAEQLATSPDDSRFDEFQITSNEKRIVIGVGMPVRSAAGILISMIIFQPHRPRQTYSKQYLHIDEYPYFFSGYQQGLLSGYKIALAICYELSIPDHSADAAKNGAEIYLVSVAKSAAGIEKAAESLAGIAQKYGMTVLLSNCVGHCDDFDCGGKTAIWNNEGILAGQLNDKDEGILMIDTVTQELYYASAWTGENISL